QPARLQITQRGRQSFQRGLRRPHLAQPGPRRAAGNYRKAAPGDIRSAARRRHPRLPAGHFRSSKVSRQRAASRLCTGPPADLRLVPAVASEGRRQAPAGVRETTGTPLQATHDPPREGDIRDSQADISEARRYLGYEPQAGFAQGLQLTYGWYRESQQRAAARAEK